ncbi:MAG: hypothetical protein KJ550_04770 [Proteobacteria bacterium]|nr:hypothetical protein [Desulfobacteraceae bacterium]MBU4012761.1 hypothetical protein [Pseudomonadota bacterium]MBU4127849.1 hypothetical protein [Pseudomonadota bacterium]
MKRRVLLSLYETIDILPQSAISRKYRLHLLIKTSLETKTVDLHIKLSSRQHAKMIGGGKIHNGAWLSSNLCLSDSNRFDQP